MNGHHLPCGKCGFCLKRRSSEWSFRLYQELKVSTSAHVVLLTYNDESVPWGVSPKTGEDVMILDKSDLQKFFKRLRKYHDQKRLNGKPIRYYAVGEYGGHGQRPHYHLIIFNTYDDAIYSAWELGGQSLGYVSIQPLRSGGLGYLTTYHTVTNDYAKRLGISPQFSVMSNGLGSSYLTDSMINWHKSGLKSYVRSEKYRSVMPRYYKEKIFNQTEKEQIIEQAKQHRESVEDDYSQDKRKALSIINEQIISKIKQSKK